MKLWASLLLLAGCATSKPVAVPSAPVAPVAMSVHGHVRAAAGRPLRFAHVRLVTTRHVLVAETTVRPDGSFTMPVPAGADRVLRLEASGVDHRLTMALVANEHAFIDVDIELGTYPRVAKPTPTISLRSAGAAEAEPRPMVACPDGTFLYDGDVANGAYEYEICGLAGSHCVNGNDTTTWRRDDDGDYASTVTVTDGHIHVVLDPSRLAPSGVEGRATFGTASGASATMTRIDARMTRLADESQEAMHPPAAGDAPDMKAMGAAMTALHADAHRDLGREIEGASGTVADVATLAWLATGREPREVERARRLRASLAPTDALWSLYPEAFTAIDELAPDPAYSDALVHENADVSMVATYLFSQLNRPNDDPAHHAKIVATLSEPRYARTVYGMMVRSGDANRSLAAGKTMPAFSFPALPERNGAAAKAAVTDRSFAGKVFLVDVWATWCAPCRAALPKLHEIYAKHKNRKDFAFLSVSIDEDAADVVRFRTNSAHPMPWTNAIAKQSEVAALAGLPAIGVPMMVLVDAKGIIVASSPELDETSLEAHLARLLH